MVVAADVEDSRQHAFGVLRPPYHENIREATARLL